jgi:hypothetical protein
MVATIDRSLAKREGRDDSGRVRRTDEKGRSSRRLIGREIDEEVGEHQGEEEDTPRGPGDANGYDEGKEDGDQLSFLHTRREGLTGGDEGKMQGGRLGFFTQR